MAHNNITVVWNK